MSDVLPKSPEHVHYYAIDKFFRESIKQGKDFLFDRTLFRNELWRLWETYQVPYEALVSFVRNLHLVHVKRTSHIVKRSLGVSLQKYTKGRSIKQLAKDANYPPYLFARLIVEAITTKGKTKKSLTKVMRDPARELSDRTALLPEYLSSEDIHGNQTNVGYPSKIDSSGSRSKTFSSTTITMTRLAMEIMDAIESDPIYGPQHDKDRHLVGVECEVQLEIQLRDLGIPFESEADLRSKGTARTPDVLLSVPVAIEVPKRDGSGLEWKLICWVDSKGLFGDVGTHHFSVLPQGESYVHRYGPGLVLYWFGHAPLVRLEDSQGDVVVVGWEFPSAVKLPSGEIVRSDAAN